MGFRGAASSLLICMSIVACDAFAESFSTRVRVYLPSDCEALLQNYSDLVRGENFVAFYGRHLPFYEFSNFWPAPISLRGKLWPTSEHYFQAMKFEGTSHEEEIRNNTEPKEIAAMGRDRNRPLRPDWELVKDRVMLEAVYAKFSQNPDLRRILLSTGDKILVEHTENDGYWGDKLNGSGSNKLGIILMVVRDVLRGEKAHPQLSIPEFMYIKFLAEEVGYRVSLFGDDYVGDARNYDFNALARSLRQPLLAESRLEMAYHLGTRSTLLKSVPWEMREDETTYNEIRFLIGRADGSILPVLEGEEFEKRVYQGLAKEQNRPITDPQSKEIAFQFITREIGSKATSATGQSGLITTGNKRATPAAASLPGQLYGKFKITALAPGASAKYPILDLKLGQEVEVRLSSGGDGISAIRIGEFVVGKNMIFAEGMGMGFSCIVYLDNTTALRLELPFVESPEAIKGKVSAFFDPGQRFFPLIQMQGE